MILALVQAPSPVLLELTLPVPELAWLKRNVMTKPESKPEAALKDSVSVAYLWPTLAMPSFRKIALMPELQQWLMEISAAFPSKNANKVQFYHFLDFKKICNFQSFSDICALRLDFVAFATLGPANTEEVDGGACRDAFVVTSDATGFTSPTLCGELTGQHSK